MSDIYCFIGYKTIPQKIFQLIYEFLPFLGILIYQIYVIVRICIYNRQNKEQTTNTANSVFLIMFPFSFFCTFFMHNMYQIINNLGLNVNNIIVIISLSLFYACGLINILLFGYFVRRFFKQSPRFSKNSLKNSKL